MSKANSGDKVKTKTKVTKKSRKKPGTVEDQASTYESWQESSDHPTREQLLAWAAEQRRLYRNGELLEPFVKALEEIPGWTWDEDPK
jgi:hypothetical protein